MLRYPISECLMLSKNENGRQVCSENVNWKCTNTTQQLTPSTIADIPCLSEISVPLWKKNKIVPTAKMFPKSYISLSFCKEHLIGNYTLAFIWDPLKNSIITIWRKPEIIEFLNYFHNCYIVDLTKRQCQNLNQSIKKECSYTSFAVRFNETYICYNKNFESVQFKLGNFLISESDFVNLYQYLDMFVNIVE